MNNPFLPTNPLYYKSELIIGRAHLLHLRREFLKHSLLNPDVHAALRDPPKYTSKALFLGIIGYAKSDAIRLTDTDFKNATGAQLAAIGKWFHPTQPSAPAQGYRADKVKQIGEYLKAFVAEEQNTLSSDIQAFAEENPEHKDEILSWMPSVE